MRTASSSGRDVATAARGNRFQRDLADTILFGEVSLPHWKLLFDTLDEARDFASLDDVIAALEHHDVPDSLLDAVRAVVLLGDEPGISSYQSAAAAYSASASRMKWTTFNG